MQNLPRLGKGASKLKQPPVFLASRVKLRLNFPFHHFSTNLKMSVVALAPWNENCLCKAMLGQNADDITSFEQSDSLPTAQNIARGLV